jgi:hypothetical protein
VLLPDPPRPAFRVLTFPDGGRGGAWDLSYVPFLIEGLIAHSAVRVAVAAGSLFHEAIAELPEALRDRLIVVDKHGEASERAHAVLAPAFDEFGVRRIGSQGYQSTSDHDSVEVVTDLITLAGLLTRFLIGARHELQIELDPREMVERSSRLLQLARGPESRACFASVAGIFRTYSYVGTPGLQLRPKASADLAEAFIRFTEDETYRRLARDAGLLGVPMQMTHAVIRMRRTLADLLKRQSVSDLATLGQQTVAVAAHVPLPEPGLITRIIGKPRYIPPLLSLGPVSERAMVAWEAADPEFRPPKGLPDHIRNARANPIERDRVRERGGWQRFGPDGRSK